MTSAEANFFLQLTSGYDANCEETNKCFIVPVSLPIKEVFLISPTTGCLSAVKLQQCVYKLLQMLH